MTIRDVVESNAFYSYKSYKLQVKKKMAVLWVARKVHFLRLEILDFEIWLEIKIGHYLILNLCIHQCDCPQSENA